MPKRIHGILFHCVLSHVEQDEAEDEEAKVTWDTVCTEVMPNMKDIIINNNNNNSVTGLNCMVPH